MRHVVANRAVMLCAVVLAVAGACGRTGSSLPLTRAAAGAGPPTTTPAPQSAPPQPAAAPPAPAPRPSTNARSAAPARHAVAPRGPSDPPRPEPRILSTVAEATVPKVPVYTHPGDASPNQELGNPNADGAPLVFLVTDTKPDWLEVFLPVRPNGTRGWIHSTDVKLSSHDFHIRIRLRAHRITAWQGTNPIDDEPIGVGRSNTPTPGGEYYVTELLEQPDPSGPYGPYAYGLSGHSDVVTNFDGADGAIGIHGTNDPSGLGHDVSHGCIRMSNAGITKLARVLPVGTPVFIEA